jgi:hypothetical protein
VRKWTSCGVKTPLKRERGRGGPVDAPQSNPDEREGKAKSKAVSTIPAHLQSIGKVQKHVRCLLVPTHNVETHCHDVLCFPTLNKPMLYRKLEVSMSRVNVVGLKREGCRELCNALAAVVNRHHPRVTRVPRVKSRRSARAMQPRVTTGPFSCTQTHTHTHVEGRAWRQAMTQMVRTMQEEGNAHMIEGKQRCG